MSCVLIQILEVPEWLPDDIEFGAGSFIYLDTDAKTNVGLAERLEELSDLNKISRQENIPIQLPSTPFNDLVLGNALNPNVDQYENRPIRVLAIWGSEILDQTYMYVTENNGPEGYVVLLLSDDHWLQLSSDKKIHTIDYGQFEWSRANIQDTFEKESYADNNHSGYYFPLVNYGAITRKAYISTRYFRPWFHVLGILQKGFKEIGFEFRSPILETEKGRRLVSYILREDFLNDIAEARSLNAVIPKLNGLPNANTPGVEKYFFDGKYILKFIDQFGTDNPFMDIETGKFTGCLFGDFSARVKVGSTTTNTVGETVHGRLVVKYQTGQIEVLSQSTVELQPIGGSNAGFNQGSILDFFVFNFQMDEGMEMYIELEAEDDEIRVRISDAFFRTDNVIYPCIEEGTVFDVNKVIRQDDSLLDYLKGVAHLFHGKFETDNNLRVVTMYTPYDLDYYGEDVEGYYSSSISIEDLTDSLQYRSLTTKAPSIETQKRYKSYEFAKTTDVHIQSKSYLSEDYPLYSVRVDLGEDFVEEVEILRNPYFEPTLSGPVASISEDSGLAAMELPYCIDNENGYESYAITRRIIHVPGRRIYFNDQNRQAKVTLFGFGNEFDHIYTGWQKSFYSGITDFGDDGSPNDFFLGFGDRYNEDKSKTHFELFIKKFLANRSQNLQAEALIFLDQNMYSFLSFRTPYLIHQEGYIMLGYLKEYSDFQLCSDISTPMIFAPDRDTNLCEDQVIPPPTNFDGNDPCSDDWKVVYERIGCCYFIDVEYLGEVASSFTGGSSTPNPTVSIEWIEIGAVTWNQYNESTGICGPTSNFIVRVLIEDILPCPAVIKVLPINVCESNYSPSIFFNLTIEDGQNCYELFIDGIPEEDIDDILWNVKEDGVTVPYTGKRCGDFTEVCADAIVETNCNCPQVSLDEVCETFPPINPDCDNNAPTLECTVDENGCATVVRGGTLAIEPGIDIIFYRCNEEDVWSLWDEEELICCSDVQWKRWIAFCGGVCDPICLEIQCGCLPFETGLSSNIAVCNDGNII